MPIDPDSLGKLLDHYWAALVQWVGGCDCAEDIVQSAFYQAGNRGTYAGELCRMAVHCFETPSNQRTCIEEQATGARAESRQAFSQSIDSAVGVEIRDMLSRLETREKEVVIARIWGGLTFEEIAAVYGESKATVWRSYQSGIAKLKAVYGELADE